MSSGSARPVTHQDILLVQNFIKRCLQQYMSPQEVVETLLNQEKFEPAFTELVWQKLEDEHPEFFEAYYLRLMVKQQIIEFNRLLEQQVRMAHQIGRSGVTSLPTSNGSHVQPNHRITDSSTEAINLTVQQNSVYTGLAVKQETLHYNFDANSIPFINGGSSFNSMHSAADMSAHGSRIDLLPNMILPQSSNIGMIQGVNGGTVKLEAEYSGSCQNMFGVDGNVIEERPTIGDDASIAHFTNVIPNTQPLSEPLLDPDIFSFGFLSQIPQNFSLSDLTVDFAQSSDILDGFGRSPFVASGANHFPVDQEREHHGDNKGLESISDGLSYDDFGSE